MHTHTQASPVHKSCIFSSKAYVQKFFAWEWGHLVCSIVPVMAEPRLVLERDDLLHMPTWESVVMHIWSLLSNLIIWHIHYEPSFFFRCGLEESANSCTCTTRGTQNDSFCRSSVHTICMWAKQRRTHSCCFLPVQHYTISAMSLLPVHIQFFILITLLILVPI